MQVRSIRRGVLLTSAVVALLAALYGLLGFFQAVMLFTGLRALKNSNIWASVFLVGVSLSVFCLRVARRQSDRAPGAVHRIGRLTFLIACCLLSVGALWRVVSDYLALDSCLDIGGSFNYVRSVCDLTSAHPALSLFAWRGVFVTAALVFAFPVVLDLASRVRHVAGRRHAL